MLGWEINVYPQKLAGVIRREKYDKCLACWETGLGGTDWLNALAKEGRAIALGGDGYPLRYVLTVGVFSEVLNTGIPKSNGPLVIGDNYVQPPGWIGTAKINWERIRALEPVELLAVEAWDQS